MKVRIVWKRKASADADPDGRPQALVDVHSHFLWGLDDGAKDLEECMAMLKSAAEHGTTDIVATPHANFQYAYDPSIIAGRIAELRAREDLPLRVHTGCDFHLGFGNIREALVNPTKFTINGLKYLLVEFADNIIPPTIEEVLRRFLAQGTVPVVTHPERNPFLQQSMRRLAEWVSMGCMLQVTAQSLSGEFGKLSKKTAWELIRENLVQVVASDAHDTVHRPPRLDLAWKLLTQEENETLAARLLIHNPQAMLEGKALPVPRQVPEPAETSDLKL